MPLHRLAVPLLVAALSLVTGARSAGAQVNCGVFSAEAVLVKFTLVGGGSWTEGGGQVITEDDTFSGTIRFRKNQPDDECADSVEVGPFTLDHKYNWRDVEGRQVTVVLNGEVSPPRAALAVGINPISGTWLLAPSGFFDGSETRIDIAPRRTTVSPARSKPSSSMDASPRYPIR